MSREIVERYWDAMNANDWSAAARLLAEDCVLDWPQSGERIRGRENFIAINTAYPAAGPWRFTLNHFVAGPNGAATDVSVTDGAVAARACTFFEVQDALIVRMTEFWPEPFPAPAWRAKWVEATPGE